MIEVAAVVIRNPQGHVLTVRKKSSTKYQLPGGKPEAGEALVDAALREVAEEVGLTLDAESLNKLGTFDAPAANEPGEVVVGYDMATQMTAQIKAIGLTLLWSGAISLILYKLVDGIVGLRPPKDKERAGLDLTDHGERGYHF